MSSFGAPLQHDINKQQTADDTVVETNFSGYAPLRGAPALLVQSINKTLVVVLQLVRHYLVDGVLWSQITHHKIDMLTILLL